MRTIVLIRKVYQMAVISIVLVALLTFIIVVSLPSSSTQDDGAITIECEPLNMAVEVTPPTTLRLTWDVNSCALAYISTQIVNGQALASVTTPHPVAWRNLQWNYCSHNIVTMTIMPRATAGSFTPEELEFTIGIQGSGAVNNLRFDEENSQFVWDLPDNYDEHCNIQYAIHFKSEALTEQIVTSNQFYEVTVYPCSINTIEVVTLIGVDDTNSDPVTGSYIGPIGRKAPVHHSTDPEWFSANVTYNIENEPFNLCEVQALTFEVLTEEGYFQGEFPTDFDSAVDVVEYSLTSLLPERIFEHRACFTLADSDSEICSPYVRFFTRPLIEPTLEVERIDIDGNSFSISWNQTYHQGFVTKNVVHIQPIGPDHFVPDNCIFDMELIEKHFDPEQTTFTFTDGRPSFQYNVTVITIFETLGRTTSSPPEAIVTSETDPGDLDINAFYQFVPNSPYDVAIRAEWPVPCDINGPIQNFTYIISGTLAIGSAAVCEDVTLLSGSITDDLDQQGPQVLTTPGILPFFQYKLIITTHLVEHQNTTVVDLGSAPQPYSPPI